MVQETSHTEVSTLKYRDVDFIVFSDFDGTITTEDSNDHMTDNLGFGRERRQALNQDVLHNRTTFRDSFREMLASVSESTSFEDCQRILKKNIKLDPGFKEFFDWAKSAKVPVVIVSSGMVPIIRSILENLLGPEDASQMEIIANEVDVKPDGKFEIVFRHPESGFGHDKSKALRIYKNLEGKRPTIFFCGDGVSDMSAAGESDVLFCKLLPSSNHDLAKHCLKESVPFVPFYTFTEVKKHCQEVVEGRQSVQELVAAGQKAAAEADI